MCNERTKSCADLLTYSNAEKGTNSNKAGCLVTFKKLVIKQRDLGFSHKS